MLPALRRSGLGRRLLDAGAARLAVDARAQGRRLGTLLAEMNDPYRHPDQPDSMDPFARAQAWGAWGFQRLLCPYTQPALSAQQAAVTYLTLIVKPLRRPAPASMAAGWVRTAVAEYMRWAMRIAQPEATAEYRAIDAYIGARRRVPMQPLQASIGQDANRPFECHELGPGTAGFAEAVRLARAHIPHPGQVATLSQFRQAQRTSQAGGPRYHLWRLSAPNTCDMHGMASFFSLPSCGFGGYVVLSGPLRGRSLLAAVVARIEARMIQDKVRVPGWFIECSDDSAPAFLRCGFAPVPLDYRPPLVGNLASARATDPEPMHLLYKTFGPVFTPPALTRSFVLQALHEILRGVYGQAKPQRSFTYLRARQSLAGADWA